MKKNLRRVGAMALATAMAFVAVPATVSAMTPLYPGWELVDEQHEVLPEFGSFTGTVTEIDGGNVRVQQGEQTVVFQKNDFTHAWGQIAVGDEVTGFWSFGGIMTLQYPPHYTARLLVNNDLGFAVLDRFNLMENGSFISASDSLILNINDDTPILLEDGQNVREILEEGQTLEQFIDGRLLAIVHGPLNRMLPPGTMPGDPSLAVTVMFETAAHPDFDFGLELDFGWDWDYGTHIAEYTYISGIVTAIEETDWHVHIFIQNPDGGTIVFIKNHLTFVQGDEVAVGDTIAGHFDLNVQTTMQYPPHYTARVIVNCDKGEVSIITADEEFIANITDDIAVHFAGGDNVREVMESQQTLESILYGRTLAVTHDDEGALLSVVVLYERAVTLPLDLGLDFDMDYGASVNWDIENPISVEGVLIGKSWVEVDGAYYVPLRAIVEALNPNHIILWDAHTRAVHINDIIITIGSATVNVGGVAHEMSHPAIIIDDITHVPFRFFDTIFGTNNAWMHAGQVFIDNEEVME
ncbi:MAG: copper amine oxidase N-terminal domain-containing protein [Defluviitaleaceae bacterium]|nr:copper amine oxidase N-terminal domain-containing protein [Defluviitaleaceae bacterium]